LGLGLGPDHPLPLNIFKSFQDLLISQKKLKQNFRKMSNILDKYTQLYEKKDLLKNAKIVNEFISSITTEEGQGIEQKLKNREEKMAAGKLAEKEQELMEKLRTHDVMNGATGSLVTFLLKIIRNILAGNGKNPKSLETTLILAEGIVIPAFDQFTESSKIVNGPKVTTYLKENLSLPKDWIEREMVIFQNKLYASEARQQALVWLYQLFSWELQKNTLNKH
jgi:hypothetical protein